MQQWAKSSLKSEVSKKEFKGNSGVKHSWQWAKYSSTAAVSYILKIAVGKKQFEVSSWQRVNSRQQWAKNSLKAAADKEQFKGSSGQRVV